MSRNVLFVLLLATGIALAALTDNALEARPVARATEAQVAKDDDVKQKKDEASKKEEDAKQKEEDAKKKEDPKSLSGMSILGNQEAPKALVIVPWKSSEIGQSPGISTVLDDSRQPVDKEVFMRMLSYYEVRSKGDAAQPAAAHGR